MKKILKLILLAVLTAALLVPFAACGDTTTTEPEPPVTGDEPFGITQRPNDLTEYEDLRPDRQPYVDNAQPDTGTLVDHIYEFEEMNISGTSNDKDHLCPNKSFVLSRDFSGYIALENIASGVFTLTLESDKEVRVPLLIGLSCNYVRNQPLSNALTITNNGHSVADTSVLVPEEGKDAQGAPGGYFSMVEVESEISLVEGTNRIVFRSVQAGPNYDYVNIRTSANLVNNTPAPAWADPTFTVKAAPTETSTGLLTIGCGEGCTDSSDDQLPSLDFEGYGAEKEGDVTTYTFDLMGQSFEVTKIDESVDKYPDDTGEKKDNYFEFENAAITGHSQNVTDHFCASDSLVFSPSFSGNFCVENMSSNTFTFTAESDKKICAEFDLGLSIGYVAGKPMGDAISVTVNGKTGMADLRAIVPEDGTTAEVGDISTYFTMAEVSGMINLDEGENVIEITRKDANLDYINIRTSATLTDNTVPYFSGSNAPAFSVAKAPTADTMGELVLNCSHSGCTKGSRAYAWLPALGSDCYDQTQEGDNIVYTIELFGRKIDVTSEQGELPEPPPEEEPDDELTDHYFEFERAAITGYSQKVTDHFCAADSLVFSPSFSGNFCLENMSDNTFTFIIDSDRTETAKFVIGLATSYAANNPIGDLISITNNGKSDVADLSAVVPSNGTTAEVGNISGYFQMTEVGGTIDLVEGENIIVITRKSGNYDYFNIRTSATLTDRTLSFWSDDNAPQFTVAQAPTASAKGVLTVTCPQENCSATDPVRTYEWLPELGSACYDAVQNGEYIDYSLDLLGQTVKVGSVEGTLPEDVLEDSGELADHFFEFENAAITGNSQNVDDHFCAADSVVVSYSFGGNVCLEATGSETKYTFTIESDRALVVPFEIRMGQTGAVGAELGTVLSMTNNGRRDLVDLTDPLPSQSDQADMGGISVYFNMVKATGKIQLTQGVNVIEITKSGGNVDYLNIMTSATLTDKTVPYWSGDHMLEFEVVTAPTKTTRGELKVTCPDEGCTKGERLYDYGSLPELTNDCYTVEDDGYYIELFGQTIKVAELTAEAA